MSPLPAWLRYALFATAAMNIVVGIAFATGAGALLDASGFPAASHPFYGLTVGLFVALFGAGYLGVALSPRPERLFLALGGAGKLAFVAMVVALALAGSLPGRAAVAAGADIPFGVLFLGWLLATRES